MMLFFKLKERKKKDEAAREVGPVEIGLTRPIEWRPIRMSSNQIIYGSYFFILFFSNFLGRGLVENWVN